MKSDFQKDGEKGKLQFSGELTVEHSSDIKNTMIASLTEVKSLNLIHTTVTAVDLTYLQLLSAFKKTAEQCKVKISIFDSASKDLSEVSKKSGYEIGFNDNEEERNE